jgi:hypothetical protein
MSASFAINVASRVAFRVAPDRDDAAIDRFGINHDRRTSVVASAMQPRASAPAPDSDADSDTALRVNGTDDSRAAKRQIIIRPLGNIDAEDDESDDRRMIASRGSPRLYDVAPVGGNGDDDDGDLAKRSRPSCCAVLLATPLSRLALFCFVVVVGALLLFAVSATGGADTDDRTACDGDASTALDAMTLRVLSRAVSGVASPGGSTSGSSSAAARQNRAAQVASRIKFCVYRYEYSQMAEWLLREAGWTDAARDRQFHRRVQPQRDAFAVDAARGQVNIAATTRSAAASGLYWYLKNALGCQVTWGADQLDMLVVFPDANASASSPPSSPSSSSTGSAGASPPVSLPDWARTAVLASTPWRHAWNMVTFGYTSTWWDWARWERELDWMALHGVNLPLAFVGQEYVWIQAFAQYGIQPEEMERWFAGPAFLPWQRAGNVQGFGGPLPMAWIIDQRDLQRKILQRMKQLGMTPVLPCFAGHVPAAARRAWPDGHYTTVPAWNRFPPQYADVLVVDPSDVAFAQISAAFMKALSETYGLTSYYSCDTFNEDDPPTDDPDYLRNASRAVVNGITRSDPDGVWLLQAWLFSPGHFPWWQVPGRVESYLSGAPRDRLLVLDLHAEDGSLALLFDNFYGRASIWCLLHNYGGVRGMYGNLSRVATGPFEDLVRDGSTVVGMAFTPESIEQNPVVYELMTENFFSAPVTAERALAMDVFPASLLLFLPPQPDPTTTTPAPGRNASRRPTTTTTGGGGGDSDSDRGAGIVNRTVAFNLTKWLGRYLIQRYGNGAQRVRAMTPPQLRALLSSLDVTAVMPQTWRAWRTLLDVFYLQPNEPRTELEMVPMIVGWSLGEWVAGTPAAMFAALEALRSAIGTGEVDAEASAGLHYDAVDIARQAGTTFFTNAHVMLRNVGGELFSDDARDQFRRVSEYVLGLIERLDDLLATDGNYLLGTWIAASEAAAASARNKTVSALMRYNAKNQITMWGPDAQISDYAAKPWAGLYRAYYGERYRKSAEFTLSINGTDRAWQVNYDSYLLVFERAWNEQLNDTYATAPSGATISATAAAIAEHIALSPKALDGAFTLYANAAPLRVMTEFIRMPLWTSDPLQLGRLCALVDRCAGFTGAGFLLTERIKAQPPSDDQVDLYLKN